MKCHIDKMLSAPAKIAFVLILTTCFLSACAQIKETGRTIGHTTRDVATAIGHGARDAAKAVGEGVKKVVKSTPEDEK
jgi:ABC-type sugar transport system substrate-binding protein